MLSIYCYYGPSGMGGHDDDGNIVVGHHQPGQHHGYTPVLVSSALHVLIMYLLHLLSDLATGLVTIYCFLNNIIAACPARPWR